MIGSNVPKSVKTRIDEQHSDLCRMWSLFGAGCDCGADEASIKRIVGEFGKNFRAALSRKDQSNG